MPIHESTFTTLLVQYICPARKNRYDDVIISPLTELLDARKVGESYCHRNLIYFICLINNLVKWTLNVKL